MSVKTFIAAMSLKVKIIIACSAAFVISGAVAAGIILTKEDTYRVLKVFEMTGSSIITREGTGDIDAYIGMNLESGDTITVGSGSTLRLALDSDKYLMLDSDTVLELIASGTAADSRTSINLKQGTILNEITTPLSANSSYEVSAPKATMAVRGTSFSVSVDKDSSGGYTIRENTLNGKVEVTLLDANGDPTQTFVIVGADKGVTIRTEPDENSGNPAEQDGKSRFVLEDENGNIIELGEGDDPIHEIFYKMLSAIVKENALRSNDEHIMELDELIVQKLRGEFDERNTEEVSEETAPAETVPMTEPVNEPVTEPEQESAPAEATAPAETAAPEAAMEAPQSVVTNAPVSTEPQPETVPETAPATSAETSPATSAETSASSVTTVPTEAKPESTSAKTTAKTNANSSGTSVSAVTAPSNTGTLPPYTGTTPSYTGTSPTYTGTGTSPSSTTVTTSSETAAPTSESTEVTSETEPEKTVYTVTFMADGALYSTELVEEGEKIGNIPEPPAKTGYTAKWYLGDAEFTYDTPITSDITVNAVYTIKKYTVTFTVDDSVYAAVEAEYNTSVKENIPAVPEKAGYSEGKWCIGSEEFDPNTLITEDITITAVYTPEEYTVTYVPSYDESIVLFEDTVKYGELPTDFEPVVAVMEGDTYTYYLWGWDEAKAAITAVTENTVITVPYVDYDLIHEIRLVEQGATVYSALFKTGDTYVLPSPTNVPEGYTFKGWGLVYSGGDYSTGLKAGTTASEPGYVSVDESNTSAPGDTVTLTPPNASNGMYNVEYRAVYEKLTFTVTIQYLDGSGNTFNAQYGDKLAEYVDITKIWTVDGTVVDPNTYEIKSSITVTESASTDTLSLDEPLFPINDGGFEEMENVPETSDIPEETVPDVTEPADIPEETVPDVTEPADIPEETVPDVTEPVNIPEETSPVIPDITP